MLSKRYRGLSAPQVGALFSGPHKSAVNSFFRVNWAVSPLPSARFAVITPGSLCPSAVLRNRMRRRVCELVRLYFEHWTRGLRVAILVKKAALTASPEVLKASLLPLLKKLS